jgi:predicted small lipoprotein YifL
MKHYPLTLLSLISLLAAACGQPGPLYLPEEAPPAQAQPAPEIKPQTDLQTPPEQAEPESKIQKEQNQ